VPAPRELERQRPAQPPADPRDEHRPGPRRGRPGRGRRSPARLGRRHPLPRCAAAARFEWSSCSGPWGCKAGSLVLDVSSDIGPWATARLPCAPAAHHDTVSLRLRLAVLLPFRSDTCAHARRRRLSWAASETLSRAFPIPRAASALASRSPPEVRKPFPVSTHPCLDSPAAVIPRLVSPSGYWIQWKSLPVLSRSLGILYSEYSTPRINMLCAVVICEILGSSCTKKRVIGKACYWKSVGMDGSLFLCQELSNLLVV
jgi:hypothetical protein